MMTSSKPWQAIVNADNLPKVIATENTLSAVKGNDASQNYSNVYSTKVINAKRYSFDDNGGGYKGL